MDSDLYRVSHKTGKNISFAIRQNVQLAEKHPVQRLHTTLWTIRATLKCFHRKIMPYQLYIIFCLSLIEVKNF